jgi:ADP-ribose pyrophosphatase
MAFEVIDSKTIFQGRVFDVHLDHVQMPNGAQVRFDIIKHNPAVTVVPVDQNGMLWFIRQYRHPAGKELLELPAGVMETGEDPQVSAQRELREETGMAAERLERIGGFYLAPGYSTEFMHIFLASGLYPAPLPQDENELIEIVPLSLAEALRLAQTAQIQDAKSLVALYWAQMHLK